MNFVRHIFRIINTSLFGVRSLKRGSKKLLKWLKKNEKNQDETLHGYDKRWNYSVQKIRKIVKKKLGIRIVLKGKENLPRGAFWMTPNHTSNFDGLYLIAALGDKSKFAAIARDDLKTDKKVRGYLISSDSFFIERNNLRQSIAVLNNASIYSKQSGRGIVIFPEGRRSFSTELLPFRSGSFKFAQKYFLPIIPVSITGTMQAKRWWIPKTRIVAITIHPPIKPKQHATLETNRVSEKVRSIIQEDLDKYYRNLSEKEKRLFQRLKVKNEKAYEKKFGHLDHTEAPEPKKGIKAKLKKGKKEEKKKDKKKDKKKKK